MMPGIYERELDELYERRREDDRRRAAERRLARIAELQQLWENCEVLAAEHEADLKTKGLPMPGTPGAYTPGELPRGYLAEKAATFALVGAPYPCALVIPLDLEPPPGSSWDPA